MAAPGGEIPGRVYLDYAGFAPVDPRVLAVMRPFLEAGIGNPQARHALGHEAREALDAARAKVARLIGASAAGVVFTSGATESNNLAIRGTVLAAPAGRRHVVTTAVEHVSVLHASRALERAGAELTVLPVDGEGRLDPQTLRAALRRDTALVSVGAANGEIGTVQRIAELAAVTRGSGVPLHVDGVSAVGRIPLAAETAGVDLLTLSGNDIYGPPGTGALWVRPGLALAPLILGGEEEGGHRAGTQSVAALVGLGVAAELMRAEGQHGEPGRLARLRDRLAEGLAAEVPECRVTGSRAARLPHHLSVILRGAKADGLLLDLDQVGIAASTGTACAAPARSSHVLRAIGCADEEVDGSLCFTLGRWSSDADVDAVLRHLPDIVARQRAGAGARPA
jgi:cysteine desulfurase